MTLRSVSVARGLPAHAKQTKAMATQRIHGARIVPPPVHTLLELVRESTARRRYFLGVESQGYDEPNRLIYSLIRGTTFIETTD
jgi:hypothetical protein